VEPGPQRDAAPPPAPKAPVPKRFQFEEEEIGRIGYVNFCLFLKKVGLVFSKVGAGAGASSQFLHGTGAATKLSGFASLFITENNCFQLFNCFYYTAFVSLPIQSKL
jgi:hypothetical protein